MPTNSFSFQWTQKEVASEEGKSLLNVNWTLLQAADVSACCSNYKNIIRDYSSSLFRINELTLLSVVPEEFRILRGNKNAQTTFAENVLTKFQVTPTTQIQ